jgi:uncharacterized protein YcbK (DUF882 family)
MRGTEAESFPLLQCDGTISPASLDKLSVLLRPAAVAKPTDESKKVAHKTTEIAPGIMKVDSGLAARLEKVMDHFKTDSHTPKVSIVSGYRPTSVGSFHALGRAIDFRLDGVDNAKLVEFCKTLPDTGCGFYPNSSFVHMDVRDGKASWIDASGPGEAPRYVTSWPPPANPDAATEEGRDLGEQASGQRLADAAKRSSLIVRSKKEGRTRSSVAFGLRPFKVNLLRRSLRSRCSS